MKIIKKISLLALTGITVFGTTVFASTGKVYNTSQGLILRGSASKTGEIITTIPNDTQVEIVEELDEWYKVKVNGKEGYLFAQYVKVEEETIKTPEVSPENNQTPTDDIKPNTTKRETKIYIVPVVTSSIIGSIPENTELNILKTLNNWAYISYENINGWIRTYNYNTQSVEVQTPEPEEAPEPEVTPEPEQNPQEAPETTPEETVQTNAPVENTNLSFTKGYINEASVNVRKEPTTDSEVVTILILNTGVSITAQTDEWYKVTYGDYTGYVYKPLVSQTPVVSNRGNEARQPEETTPENEQIETPAVPDTNVKQEETPAPVVPNAGSAGEKIVTLAKQYLGYRYVYGGTTPGGGFDCSGFVYYLFNTSGYSVSRSLSVQARTGTAVSKAELQPGDVVFFDNTSNGSLGHVGIYIGNGQMIHAANSRRGVVTDTINSGYYNTYYHSARRIAN